MDLIDLSFRPAEVADARALDDLVHRCYRAEESRVGWTTEADYLGGRRTDLETLCRMLESPEDVVLLAELGSELVGCCHLHPAADHAYFGMFAVRPDLQGSGIGSALLAHAERFARERWHSPEMRLYVLGQRAEVISYYERRGYKLTGDSAPFSQGESRFSIPKRDDLYFVLMAKPLTGASSGSATAP